MGCHYFLGPLVCVEARVVSRCNVETGMTKGTLRTRRLRQSTTRLNVSQTFDYYQKSGSPQRTPYKLLNKSYLLNSTSTMSVRHILHFLFCSPFDCITGLGTFDNTPQNTSSTRFHVEPPVPANCDYGTFPVEFD